MKRISRWFTRRRNNRRLRNYLANVENRKRVTDANRIRVDLHNELGFFGLMLAFGIVLSVFMGFLAFCDDKQNQVNYEEVYKDF